MGCDIHIIAEVKQKGKWKKNTDKVFKNPYFDIYEKIRTEEPARYEELKKSSKDDIQKFQVDPSSSRDYDWFAILANVRNGYGFAGEGFDVIAQPKGLPEDISIEGKKYVSDPFNFHSASFLTLDEFDNFDWNQLTMKYGVISLEQYKKLKDGADSPEEWSGSISGPKIVTVSPEIADAILVDPEIGLKVTREFWNTCDEIDYDNGTPASEYTICVQYEWPVQYREWFKHEIENIVKPMRKLIEVYEDVRIVFAFDN